MHVRHMGNCFCCCAGDDHVAVLGGHCFRGSVQRLVPWCGLCYRAVGERVPGQCAGLRERSSDFSQHGATKNNALGRADGGKWGRYV